MFMRTLMTTVAMLALAAPAAAQDQESPDDAAQQMEQQAQPKPEEGAAQTGQTEQQAQPAQPQEEPAEGEEAPAMAEEPAEGEEQMAEEPTPPPDMKFIQVQEAEQFLANDEVIGKDVVNANDEAVSTIADLVMDPEQKLVGVVLAVGGFLGIGEKWVAVPVEQIDFPTDEQPARLQIQVTTEQLQNAPDFVTKETAQAQQEADQAQQQMQQGTAPAPTTAQ